MPKKKKKIKKQQYNKCKYEWARNMVPLLLYSHKDFNNNSNTNTNTGGPCRFRYERVYQFLASVLGDSKRETQFLKANANHNMLTPLPTRGATLPVEIRKTQPHASTAENSTIIFSTSSNSRDHLFWA